MYSLIRTYFFGDTSNTEPATNDETSTEQSSTLPLLKEPTNFYYLSLINEANNTWSIHGLWPQYKMNQYPTFCKNIKFDIDKLKTIINDLEKCWYSKKSTDAKFWEHEYLKHGTCNFNKFDELEYFTTTLTLFQKALELKLPEQFYNENTKKCLIPVNQHLDFFIVKV